MEVGDLDGVVWAYWASEAAIAIAAPVVSSAVRLRRPKNFWHQSLLSLVRNRNAAPLPADATLVRAMMHVDE